jgi:glycosyltransferase involved in cell wall biosynthesis
MAYSKKMTRKPSLLWLGDAVAHTGFATVTHGVIDNLYKKWTVDILGINYYGDPHPYPYNIWPAYRMNADMYGFARLPGMLHKLQPDLVCILNDPWACKDFLPIIKEYNDRNQKSYEQARTKNPGIPEPKRTKTALYTPVDALNLKSDFIEPLNYADLVVGYTEFGVNQMLLAGLTTHTAVVPHGIDARVFFPMPKAQARKQLNIPEDWFIVGCINRNQPRKRLDLAFQYFAEWVADKPQNVKIYYHGALTDVGWDVVDLAKFFGIEDRLVLTSNSISAASGVSRDVLRCVYNSFDIQISTTMGEGWGLTAMEGMACKIPQVLPDWSALGEWARSGSVLIPCSNIGIHPGGINTVGGIPDKNAMISAINDLYQDVGYREKVAQSGLDLVKRPEFKWSAVASRFDALFTEILQ